ncbi:hypothetical protein GDO78_000901 [Eleutherodactylus coqui]|uniref:Uncharacterized protein n=1 Tax=Eleutherodactylus coqui TaxID=57060 RepID=A0A8J6KG52_ELECQ|nr:hypothetical protein GDO78_000901 [Eleutherodactylus coqui]
MLLWPSKNVKIVCCLKNSRDGRKKKTSIEKKSALLYLYSLIFQLDTLLYYKYIHVKTTGKTFSNSTSEQTVTCLSFINKVSFSSKQTD